MRFRLTTLLAATFTAALLMWANFREREVEQEKMLESRLYQFYREEDPAIFGNGFAQGWPAIVYEERNFSSFRHANWQPWAIAVNVAFSLGLVAAVAFVVERLERKRARRKQERLKA